MITNMNPAQYQPAKTLLASHTDVSASTLASLKMLLTTAPYAGQTLAQQVTLLNSRSTVASPPRANVPIKAMPINKFAAILSDVLVAVAALPDTNPQKSQIMAAYQIQQGPLSLAQTVDFTGAAVQGLLALIVQSGAATQAEVTTFSTQPDPTWKPQTTQPSPFESIVGANALAEADDVRQALASTAPAGS